MLAQENSKEIPSAQGTGYHFGDFSLDPRERLLTRAGQTVPLPPKTFDALLCLVENAEHLVSKQQLMDELWPDTYVCEANLTNTVAALRRVLGREAIQTVSRYGYRFALPVHGVPAIARATYDMFVRAKELTVQRSLDSMTRAREILWLCIAEHPDFAPAWAWLGRCCWFLGKFSGNAGRHREIADAALRRAFAIDRDLACAHQFYTPLEADMGHARRALARLRQRLSHHPDEPESYTGLVQVLRFCGLLEESIEAHRTAIDRDPTAVTSVPHTLFLSGDYMGTIESYGGRTGYYLDAAAWAALGETSRTIELLRDRIARTSLSESIGGLMASLLAIVEQRIEDAVSLMDSLTEAYDAEMQVYLARHYSFIGASDAAVRVLRRATASGFVCSPSMLRADPWLGAVRRHEEFPSQMAEADRLVAEARELYCGTPE
jgi:DNA-binding winged helix-turn-helix (wHTH) protein